MSTQTRIREKKPHIALSPEQQSTVDTILFGTTTKGKEHSLDSSLSEMVVYIFSRDGMFASIQLDPAKEIACCFFTTKEKITEAARVKLFKNFSAKDIAGLKWEKLKELAIEQGGIDYLIKCDNIGNITSADMYKL